MSAGHDVQEPVLPSGGPVPPESSSGWGQKARGGHEVGEGVLSLTAGRHSCHVRGSLLPARTEVTQGTWANAVLPQLPQPRTLEGLGGP